MGFKISKIEENIIRFDMLGDFDAEDASACFNQTTALFAEAALRGKKLHVYVDTTQFGNMSVEGRRMFSKMNKDERQGSVAMVGVNRILKIMVRFIMVASGQDNVRFFDNEAQAIKWLKSLDN